MPATIDDHPLLRQSELSGVKFGLEKIKKALAFLHHPEKSFETIHIAGTNGKGSTARFIADALCDLGYTTGLFTSPHLFSVTERIQVNKTNIPEKILCNLLDQIAEQMKNLHAYPPLTYFEVITLAAFLYFKNMQVSHAILEVGLGGRLDATNVITSPLGIITSIGLDHEHYLGNSLESIAREKAGILHGSSQALLGNMPDHLVQIIRQETPRAKFEQYQKNFNIQVAPENTGRLRYESEGSLNGITFQPACKGMYQRSNYALALRALEISTPAKALVHQTVQTTLQTTRCPARMQILSSNPLILLDAAHNPQGMEALKETLGAEYAGEQFTGLFGCSRDKNASRMLEIIAPHLSGIILTASSNERSAAPADIYEGLPKYLQKQCRLTQDVTAGIKEGRKAQERGGLLVMGSIFLMADVLNRLGQGLGHTLKNQCGDPGKFTIPDTRSA